MERGILEVWDPTNNFMGFIEKKGYKFSEERYKPCNIETKYIRVQRYAINTYKGIIGNGAKFKGELI